MLLEPAPQIVMAMVAMVVKPGVVMQHPHMQQVLEAHKQKEDLERPRDLLVKAVHILTRTLMEL